MAYFAPGRGKSENGFQYPDPESIFDSHSEHQSQVSALSASPHQISYPSPTHQAMYQATTSIAERPHQSSFSNPLHEGQVTPVRRFTPPPILDSASQHTEISNGRFVPYPAGRQQRKRGTTGSIVCADCGGRFTVRSSLNRHSKLCRGRKKAWQPNSTQYEAVKIPDGDGVSNLRAPALAADDYGSVFSEGVGSIAGFNPNSYHLPPNRTRFASHNIKDSSLANDLSNDASLTAESNWSPPGQHNQVEGLDSNFHTMSATNTSFSPSNAQSPSLTSGSYTPSSSAQKAIGTRSYVPQSRDESADHNPFFCNVCYGIFPSRDLLQLHRASAHGLTEMRIFPE